MYTSGGTIHGPDLPADVFIPACSPTTTDCRAAIQAALDAANTAGGGEVWILNSGTYNLTKTANPYYPAVNGMNPWTCLSIPGPDITLKLGPGVILRKANSQQTDADGAVDFLVWYNQDNITIEGPGTISGNTAGQTGWTGSTHTGDSTDRYSQVNSGCLLHARGTALLGNNRNRIGGDLKLIDNFSNPINFEYGADVNIGPIYCSAVGEGPQAARLNRLNWTGVKHVDPGVRTTATPSSTDTSADTVTFASTPGWATGTKIKIASSSGGLVANTTYYYRAVSATVGSFHSFWYTANNNTSKVNLTGNVTQVLTGDTTVVVGDMQENALCTDVTVTDSESDGYSSASGFDLFGSKRVIMKGWIARKAANGLEHSTDPATPTTSEDLILDGFLFDGLTGTNCMFPTDGRCTITNGMIQNCAGMVGISISTGESGADGLIKISNVLFDGLQSGIAVALSDGVSRRVLVDNVTATNCTYGIASQRGAAGTGILDIGIQNCSLRDNTHGIWFSANDGSWSPTGYIKNNDMRDSDSVIEAVRGADLSDMTISGNLPELSPIDVASILVGFDTGESFHQDVAKTIVAAVNDPVRVMTVQIGGGSTTEAVAASDSVRPIRKSGGLEFDGTKLLIFDGGTNYPAAGPFTMYMVGRIASNGSNWMGISGASTIIRYLDGNLYISPGFIVNFSSVGGLETGTRCLVRIRRTAGNVVYAWGSGMAAELTSGSSAVNFNFSAIGGTPGSGQLVSGNSLIEESWAFDADLVASGDAAAMDWYFFRQYDGLRLGE